MLRPLLAFLLTLLLLFLLLPFPPASQAQAQAQTSSGEYWAVIVGVSDYQNFGPQSGIILPTMTYDLAEADDDARDLAARLSYAWGQDHIKLLIDSEATKANIENSIFYWLDPREDADDVVLFFFAGHGIYDSSGHQYLCAYDSSSGSYAYDIQDAEVDAWLDQLESTGVVVILDSCYSGGFIDELSQSGRVILAACERDKSSRGDPVFGHGIFTYYILQGFDNAAAVDANGDHKTSVEELFYYAESKVVEYTAEDPPAQHPQLYNGYAGELDLLPQYYLSVSSNYGEPQGGGWYNMGAQANVAVSSSTGMLIRHFFTGWSGDLAADSSSITVFMDEPKAVTAHWRADYTQIYILLGVIGGSAGIAFLSIKIFNRSKGKGRQTSV